MVSNEQMIYADRPFSLERSHVSGKPLFFNDFAFDDFRRFFTRIGSRSG